MLSARAASPLPLIHDGTERKESDRPRETMAAAGDGDSDGRWRRSREISAPAAPRDPTLLTRSPRNRRKHLAAGDRTR